LATSAEHAQQLTESYVQLKTIRPKPIEFIVVLHEVGEWIKCLCTWIETAMKKGVDDGETRVEFF